MSGILVPKPMLGRQLRKGHRSARGLVGYWLFNEGSGNKVFDLSGNGNTGTFNGNPQWVPGKFGSAIDFDGTGDYIEIDDADILTPNKLSAFCLVKSNDITFSGLLGKYNSAVSQRSWSMHTNTEDKLQVTLSSTLTPWTGIQRYTNNALVDGVWQWVGFVFDGGAQTLKLYVNDVEQATTDASGSVPTGLANNTLPLLIGRANRVGIDADDLDGQIDRVMIHNRALSASERTELYLRPFAMFDRMPIELWVGATSVGVPAVGNPWNYYAQIA